MYKFSKFFMNRSSYAINYTRGVLGNLSEYWTEYIRAKHWMFFKYQSLPSTHVKPLSAAFCAFHKVTIPPFLLFVLTLFLYLFYSEFTGFSIYKVRKG